jgi:iron complex outermembrane recepter protein
VRDRRLPISVLILMSALAAIAAHAQDTALEEIRVVGSRLKSERAFTSSPVVSVMAQDYSASGFTAVSDIARVLPVNTGSEFNVDPFTQNLSAGTSNFNLRGLGLNATLVLLNGRRQTISGGVADDGSTFVDLNALIPLIALERLDVLKDGAAALYGTDAVAGVADFVTRSSFTGAEVQIDYANAANTGQGDVTASGIIGGGTERFHGMAAASYLRRSWLPAPDRAYTAGKGLSSFGQPGAFILLQRSAVFPDLPFGITANQPIIDPDCGGAGGGNPNPRTPQPAGVSSGRVGTCLFDFSPYYHLIPRERRWNGYSSGELELTDDATVYAEAAYAWNSVLRGTSPSFPILNSPIVPANNPGNIFGVPALFLGRTLGASSGGGLVPHRSDTWRGVLGAKGNVGRWQWDIAATHSKSDFLVKIGNDLTDRFLAALQGRGGPNNNQFFNPFGSAARSQPGDATYNDPKVIDDFTSRVTYDYRTRLSTLDATLSGDVLQTAWGPWGLAVGGQFRRERVIGNLDDQFNRENYIFFVGGPDFAGTRRVWAAFTEVRGPVSETLSAQLALRHESSGGGLSSTDPKFGLTWQPRNWLTARASTGTSFRAPSTFQAFSAQMVQENIFDPLTGTTGFRAIRTLGSTQLKPEQATTSNFGLTLQPTQGLRFSADYWRFDYTDIIVKLGAQAIVDANPFDARIIRATGQILRIDTGYINASKALTDGLDLSLSQSWTAANLGEFTASAEATWINRFVIQDTPTAPRRDVVGNRNFRTFARSLPAWRANGSLAWRRETHSASATVRVIGAYHDDQNANRLIKSQTTLDLQYGYDLSGAILGEGRHTRLSVGALNLLNAAPPNVLTNAGYDSKVHDPRGRVLYVRLKTAWQ